MNSVTYLNTTSIQMIGKKSNIPNTATSFPITVDNLFPPLVDSYSKKVLFLGFYR